MWGEMERQPRGESARVDESERGTMLEDQLHQALVDLLPHLGRHDRLERRGGNLDRQIERARVAGVDDAGAECWVAGARQKGGDVLDRLLGSREPDALETPPGEVLEPFERH